MGILETLTLVLVVLKTAGLIDLSWWWVLAPLLVAIALWAVAFLVLCKSLEFLDRL